MKKRGCMITMSLAVGILLVSGFLVFSRWLVFPPSAESAERLYAELAASGLPKTRSDLLPPLKPGESNAVEAIEKARNSLKRRHLETVWSKPDPEFKDFLNKEAEWVDLMTKAAHCDVFRPPLADHFDEREGQNLTTIGNGAKVFARWGNLLAKSGDGPEALVKFDLSRRLTCFTDDVPSTVSALSSAITVQVIARSACKAALAHQDSAGFLSGIRRILESEFPDPDPGRTITAELVHTLAMLDKFEYGPGDVFDDLETKMGKAFKRSEPRYAGGLPRHPISRALAGPVLELYKAEFAIMTDQQKTPDQRLKAFDEWMKGFREKADKQKLLYSVAMSGGPGSYHHAVSASGCRMAALAYVIVLQSRAKTGAFPESAKGLAGFPIDPATEKAIGYARTPDGFRVWSTGLDLVDNGGRERVPGGPIEGSDLVLTYPLPKKEDTASKTK